MSEEKIFDVSPGEVYEEDRSRLSIFFGILTRKFWKLITINFMFMLFNLPAIILSLFLSPYLLGLFLPAALDTTQNDLLTVIIVMAFPVMIFLMAVPVITVGPAQAGLSYLMKCYSYELPTFIWSDFKDKMKENFKQGLIISLINLFAVVFLIVDLYLYGRLTNGEGILMPIANGLMIVIFVLFLMMSMYIYPMMVGYSLKLKDLYKNALLFAFARFLPNLGVLLLCFLLIMGPIIITWLTASIVPLAISYVIYLCFGYSLPSLIINFVINPTIDKFLKPEESAQSEKA
jgi:uncharacterized membrane protein YesL